MGRLASSGPQNWKKYIMPGKRFKGNIPARCWWPALVRSRALAFLGGVQASLLLIGKQSYRFVSKAENREKQ